MMSQLFRKKSVDKILAESESSIHNLKRTLRTKDLVGFGIAAIIGAGIFSTIGRASYEGGPAVIFLFIFTAIACGFTAFAYAEFASIVPVSGSAYTYSYVAFGELFAWIIGWALIMEYAIGNIVLAISWSDYFTTLLSGVGLHLPEWMTMDYFTAKTGHEIIANQLSKGFTLEGLKTTSYAQDIPKYLAFVTTKSLGVLILSKSFFISSSIFKFLSCNSFSIFFLPLKNSQYIYLLFLFYRYLRQHD